MAGAHHHAHLRRQLLQRIIQRGEDARLGNQMRVVQNQHARRAPHLQDVVDQHANHLPDLRAGIGQAGQEGTGSRAATGLESLQRGDQIGQKEGWVVVSFVEGKPGNRLFACGWFGSRKLKTRNPFGDESRLAIARGGRDERQAAIVLLGLTQLG